MDRIGSPAFRQWVFAWALARRNRRYENSRPTTNRGSSPISPAGCWKSARARGQISAISLNPVSAGWEWNPPHTWSPILKKRRRGWECRLICGQVWRIRCPSKTSSVDAVVGTLVLRCVHNPQLSLKEVIRVLKPGGCFLFIEHVAAQQVGWLRFLEGGLKPIWCQMEDGCHPDRETELASEPAGFDRVAYERFVAPSLIVSPRIVATAAKAG